jgi:hypothetical protein
MGPDVMTVEDFLDRGLLLLDKDIQERVEKAASNGNVLRYVCVIEGQRYLFSPPFILCHSSICVKLSPIWFSPFSCSFQILHMFW